MKKYLIILLLFGCVSEDFHHTPDSILGVWKIQKITVPINNNEVVFDDCKDIIPVQFYNTVFLMDINFQDLNVASLEFCDGYLPTTWVLRGDKISFYAGSMHLNGTIIDASPTTLVIEFDIDYSPFYSFTR